MPKTKKLLISRLADIVQKIELLENPKRNARILELALGLNGEGPHTQAQIKEFLDVEYPEATVSTERIRVIKSVLVDSFGKELVKSWDEFFENLFDYLYSQVPIEIGLLAQRLADPKYQSFNPKLGHQEAFSEKPFNVLGLMKILEFRPKVDTRQLKIKRLYFEFNDTRIKGRERNTKESTLFLIPNNFNVKLENLLNHAERAVKFNGMIQEQILLPLMPKKLPVHKREELAHSLLICHKDFMWLDERLGYLTLTNSLDNRITRFAAKIFKVVDEISIALFSCQISRAVRAQARALRSDSDLEFLQERSNLLNNVSYGSDIPFKVQDALMYFVRAGLCTIDESNTLRPTELLLDNVDVSLRRSEEIMMDVLKNAPNQTLSNSEFREKSIKEISERTAKLYDERFEDFIAKDIILKKDQLVLFNRDSVDSLKRCTRSAIESQRSIYKGARQPLYLRLIELASLYIERAKKANASIASNRTQLRKAKADKKVKLEKIESLESTSSDLRLLKAECSDFSLRVDKLQEELQRLNRKVSQYEKAGESRRSLLNSELERIHIAERHMSFCERLLTTRDSIYEKSIQIVVDELCSTLMSLKSSEVDEEILKSKSDVAINDVLGSILNRVEGIDSEFSNDLEKLKFTDILIYRVISDSISLLDRLDSELPEPNDKFSDLILNLILELPEDSDGNRSTTYSEFKSALIERAIADERNHAVGHFNQHNSYSPLFVRVRKAEYSYVGTEASKHADFEYI
ncbi:hypothetical protein P3719_18595 [Vibrio parahaemolyticus]|uniref:Uncharacterized protein n=13 Tax=Vibrio TaxID=662 RepID=A0AA47JN58_VIBPH|nr:MULTISPECIES: hypothetical protein [Vibrio]EJG1066157.1 hypothetical protein [Vibrio parahaemolyticus O1]MDW1807480.1 hypothetical protein [Vibrio sp. Vb2362]MDW2296362.1 hypothetical protein [Vibrio sp. 1404]OOH98818.1 hypothetical protein BIW16_18575 [Vibrio sp. OULL4]APX09846.1 hypothetical protein BWP24_26910 [Vibrio campbellii]